MLKAFWPGLRLLLREWRAGELRVLAFGIVVAVAGTTAVGSFADRVARGLLNQSADVFGADIVLSSPRPVDVAWLDKGRDLGLHVSTSAEFASVVVNGDNLALAGVRAVDSSFPLRGEVRVSARPYAPDHVVAGGPAPGEAWADARLMNRLALAPGESVQVGEAVLRVGSVLAYEPGSSRNLFGVAPRLLMNLDDVPRTAVVQPGSRVTWRFQLAGPPAAIMAWRGWVEPRLGPSEKLATPRDGRRALGSALERAERYLGLAMIVAVVLSGVAVAMAARRYSERHFDMSALLRCLGCEQRDVLALFGPQLLALGVSASTVGVAAGIIGERALAWLLSGVLPATLTPPGPRAAVAGLLTGLVVLTGFALPPLLRLRRVSPLRVLRRELAPMPSSGWVVYGTALIAVSALMWHLTGSIALTLAVLAGAAGTVLVLGVFAAVLLLSGRRLPQRVGVAWRFGFNNLRRRARQSVGQVLAFGIALMAMATIALVRTDLLDTWRAQLPRDVPNHFAYNIVPEQLEPFRAFLHDHQISASHIYPMVRGRLVAIGGEPVRKAVSKEERSDEALDRELNLTWTDALQSDNVIVSGRWWTPTQRGEPLVSVEARLAARLGIHPGDSLEFSIGGRPLVARVASLRSVQWDSFRPNFYMIFPPGVLEDYPATWMTSFYLRTGGKDVLRDLVHAFPSVTVLDFDVIIAQVERILGQVTSAVEFVLLFVLAAGFAVLLAALQSSLDERLREGALLRTLGADRRQLRTAHAAEFATLGLFAGLVAAAGTECLGWVLYTRVLELDWHLQWQVWLATPLAGALLVGAAGYWATAGIARTSPLAVLRRL